jgi:hypothetical protein
VRIRSTYWAITSTPDSLRRLAFAEKVGHFKGLGTIAMSNDRRQLKDGEAMPSRRLTFEDSAPPLSDKQRKVHGRHGSLTQKSRGIDGPCTMSAQALSPA